VTQWRIELGAEDLAALTRGEEVTVVALDDEADASDDPIDVTVTFREY
jgi:hypothetical protein